MKRLVLILLVVLLNSTDSVAVKGYDYTPVLIHLDKRKQHDTIGFNLVEHLPKLIYKRIMDGSVNLWGSPLKKIKISVSRLQQIEKESGTKFLNNNDLFVNEYWKLFRKDFEFNIIGFSFFNRSESGVKVNYGFVDVEDIKAELSSLIIPCNANGYRLLNYWDALLSKRYQFDLVKFGKVDFIKKPRKSFELKNQAFNCEKIKTNAKILEDKKLIFSQILKSGKYSKNDNYLIYSSFEKYFNENKQDFLTLAPEGKFSHLDQNLKISIENIEIKEHWDRDPETGLIRSELVSLTIFANGVQLKTLNRSEISKLEFLIKFKAFQDFIKDKSYDYIIKRVNSQEIIGYQAEDVKKSLLEKPWHLILYSENSEE